MGRVGVMGKDSQLPSMPIRAGAASSYQHTKIHTQVSVSVPARVVLANLSLKKGDFRAHALLDHKFLHGGDFAAMSVSLGWRAEVMRNVSFSGHPAS